MRIVVLACGLELGAIRPNEGGEFSVRGAMPGGLSVVGFDQAYVATDQFGVIAIGKLGVEGVGSGFAIGCVKGTFDDHRCCLGERLGAACSFDVLVYDFLRVLRTCWLSKQGYAKDGGYCEIASKHGVQRQERNCMGKVSPYVRNQARLFVIE